MVAAIEAVLRGLDPSFEADVERPIVPGANLDGLSSDSVLRSAGRFDLELARWQQHHFAVAAVNLLLEKEVGRQSPRLRRVNVPRLVAKGEPGVGRAAIVVLDRPFDGDRRAAYGE